MLCWVDWKNTCSQWCPQLREPLQIRLQSLLNPCTVPLFPLATTGRLAARNPNLLDGKASRHTAHGGGQNNVAGVNVSTLHSLALRTLRRADLLAQYPVDPLVLDDWELTNIFDGEFGCVAHINSKTRREKIREFHEAFWNTGAYNPANYLPANPPITAGESASFLAFHGPTTQTYSCVLAGEIVRQCVQHMQAGHIDPVALLGIDELIVDEFQDLNPMDLDFVRGIVNAGATTFICGDDDQSIYSFRYATPAGIQTFNQNFPATSSHLLGECFRCMPAVLTAPPD